MLLVCGILDFFAAAFYVLTKAVDSITGSQADTHCEDAQDGNDFFHGVSFLI